MKNNKICTEKVPMGLGKATFIVASGSHNAIPLEPNDRRWYVIPNNINKRK